MHLKTDTISIFNYQNPHQFLLDYVRFLQNQDSKISVRALAERMGMKSHALLLMLLQGKRPLRVKHALPIAKGLGLSSQERLYFQALIQVHNAVDFEEKQLCSLWLSELHPTQPIKIKEVEDFELVSNWLHMALLAFAETSATDLSAEGISLRFGKKATVTEIRAALERLKNKGLINKIDENKFTPSYQRISTTDDIANEGTRKYHRSMLKFAEGALESPLSRREFQSFSINMPEDKIPLAKEMIRKFRTQFAKAMGKEAGQEVFQLSIQFFQLTESPSHVHSEEDEGVASEWETQSTQTTAKKRRKEII